MRSVSALQSEVQDVLRGLGHPSELEAVAAQGCRCVARVVCNTVNTTVGASMDLYVPSLDIYVEFDGPTHFFRNAPFRRERTGPTNRKWQWLQEEGLKVVRVAYWEWEETTVRGTCDICVVPFTSLTVARREAGAAGVKT